jgi:hypothetical protein
MTLLPQGLKVHLALGYTDMRNYAEHMIMRSPRRGRSHRRGILAGFTPHNHRSGSRC